MHGQRSLVLMLGAACITFGARPRARTLAISVSLALTALLSSAPINAGDSPREQFAAPGRLPWMQNEPAKGPAVSGRVTVFGEGPPVRGAVVTLLGLSAETKRVAMTDRNGRFVFPSVEPGAYLLKADAAGFSPPRRLDDPERGGYRELFVPRKGNLASADLGLLRLGAISGRLLDQSKEPVVGIGVQALTIQTLGDVDRLVPAPTGRGISDERGYYRLYGLTAGRYYILACPPPFELAGNPSDSVQDGAVPTLYPSAADLERAAPVSVVAGQELPNVDIVIRYQRTFALSGKLIREDGLPLADRPVRLLPGRGVTLPLATETSTRGNGEFTFEGLPRGVYTLQTIASDERPELFGAQVITVERETHGIELIANRPVTFSGKFEFDRTTFGVRADELALVASPVDFAESPVGIGARVSIRRDFSFKVAPVWGAHRLDLLRAPPGWQLEGVELNGDDFTDKPLRPELAIGGQVRVLLTNRVTSVSGEVLKNAAGDPAAYAMVVLFSADPSRWDYRTGFVKRTVTDFRGRFSLTQVRPGDYFLAAAWSLSDERWSNRDVLEALRKTAHSVSLRSGDAARAKLSVTNWVEGD